MPILALSRHPGRSEAESRDPGAAALRRYPPGRPNWLPSPAPLGPG
ncbi:hypothetical protein SGCZBJ_18835 [Caulobacter zeae]|uniref:Uncharacterized protein n=1 Tax=Caulobacter zeae TaxID=2055137 RepID=A0A2N5D862_9CAUL|nr:hypothetical protein [Caulobacter zeae]PLR22254.1 hypothetical protein SGCZBJ_18835 [Caulobacter zeae]